jgi:hypothetical protein
MLRVPTLEVRDPVILFIRMEADDPPGNRRSRTCVSLHQRNLDQCDIVVNCFGVPTWIIPTAPFSASANE